jgi:hypothetical protein
MAHIRSQSLEANRRRKEGINWERKILNGKGKPHNIGKGRDITGDRRRKPKISGS